MSNIGNKGDQSTSTEVLALTNLTALAISGANQFIQKTGTTTFQNTTIAQGGGSWGTITGTLSAQTDLQAALNAKSAGLASVSSLSTSATTSLYTMASGVPVEFRTATNSLSLLYLDDTNGRVGINTNAPESIFHIVATTGTTLTQTLYTTGLTASSGVNGQKYKGTRALPTAVITDDVLTGMFGAGYTSAPAMSGNKGAITINAAEGYTSTNQGAYLTFQVTPVASTTRAEMMRLTAAGHLNIGNNTSTSARLVVNNGAVAESIVDFQDNGTSVFIIADGGALVGTANWSNGVGNSFTTGTIELGNATDTTLSRVSAGVVAVENVTLVDVSSSQALTNKTYNGNTFTAGTGTLTIAASKVLTANNTLTLAGTDSTTMTFPSTSATLARTDAAQTFTGTQTFSQIVTTNNAITASGNAATVPITSRISTVTNNSAATLTITITTTSAVDGQQVMVRVLDFSAVAQTITWVNTENSSVSAPTTSNGSTTLPLTVGFQYNSNTSKWRCLASA